MKRMSTRVADAGVPASPNAASSPAARSAKAGPTAPALASVEDFDAIYAAHFDLVWRTLRRLGVAPESIADSLQEVFLVVHRRLAEFRGESSLKTWICGIAVRIASEAVRKQRRRRWFAAPEVEPMDTRPDPLECVVRNEAADLLNTVLAELDEKKRSVFVLIEIEDLAVHEVAAIVGANPNTVASRLRVARKQFDAALKRHKARESSKVRLP
jgi:RNA polymerase sigma-70 factor (ECF subfamily)